MAFLLASCQTITLKATLRTAGHRVRSAALFNEKDEPLASETKSDVEETVRRFYDDYGWVQQETEVGETSLFRRFSAAHDSLYYPAVERRTASCFDNLTGKLLIAGGGDMPDGHVAIAARFPSVTCIDISEKAIALARDKLGPDGHYITGSILDMDIPDDQFDAVFCAHVIYHIDQSLQQKAVRQLVRVTRPGGRVVIIYRNPNSLPSELMQLRRRAYDFLKLSRTPDNTDIASFGMHGVPQLYDFTHPLDWWKQFCDDCNVNLRPWHIMGCDHEGHLLKSEAIARAAYRLFSWFENSYPDRAVRLWHYPIAILTKKNRPQS